MLGWGAVRSWSRTLSEHYRMPRPSSIFVLLGSCLRDSQLEISNGFYTHLRCWTACDFCKLRSADGILSFQSFCVSITSLTTESCHHEQNSQKSKSVNWLKSVAASNKGKSKTDDPIKYFAAPDNQDLDGLNTSESQSQSWCRLFLHPMDKYTIFLTCHRCYLTDILNKDCNIYLSNI